MSPVLAVVVSVASYVATLCLGIWYGLRWHRKNIQALQHELRHSALQAAECYWRGFDMGTAVAHDKAEEDPRWSNN